MTSQESAKSLTFSVGVLAHELSETSTATWVQKAMFAETFNPNRLADRAELGSARPAARPASGQNDTPS
jgi:hypothetical protein